MTNPLSEDDGLNCCPEWCESQGEPHDETCPEHTIDITKAAFVTASEAAARAAIDTFIFFTEEDETDWSRDDAIQLALDEAREGSVCFAGIGSCGRGWCKH